MKGDDGVERGREERVKGGAGTTHPQRGPPRTFHRQTLMAASSSSPPSALPTRIQSDTGTRRSRSTSSTVCGTGGGRGGGKGGGGFRSLSPPPRAPQLPVLLLPGTPLLPVLPTPPRPIPVSPSPRSSPAPRAPPRRCPPGSRTSLRRAPSSSSSTALPAALSVAVLTIRTLLNVACTERNERGGPKARPPQTASLFAVGLAGCPVPPHRSEEVVVHRSEDVNGDAVAPLQPPQGAAQLPAPRVAAVLWGHGDGAGGTDPPAPPRVPESPPAALTILPTRCRSAGCTAVTLLLGGSRSSHVAWGRAGGAWGGQRSA